MYSGYLMKRNSSPQTPTMQRVYCCLWGTLLMDFESEQDADSHCRVKATAEVIGTSKWDGLGSGAAQPNGFLAVTHTGTIYYLSAPSEREMHEWMQQLRYGLECNFANPDVIQFKPSKALYDGPSHSLAAGRCSRSGAPFGSTIPVFCPSCGRGFLPEHVAEPCPLLQLSIEEAVITCSDCKCAQTCLLWLKEMNYVSVAELHERTPAVLSGVQRFKASFKYRRQCSQALEHAAQLLDMNEISLEEFEELRRVDHDFRQAASAEEKERLRTALLALGNDVQTIISLLSNPTATYSARSMGSDTQRNSTVLYLEVIIRLLEIGDREPDLLDFFWPQLLQIHLLMSKTRSQASMLKVNLLHCAFLAVAKKLPFFATKLAWSLIGSISDFKEKKISDNQYAACMCLLLQLEIMVSGSALSLTKHLPVRPLPSAPTSSASGSAPKFDHAFGAPHLSPFPTAAGGLGAGPMHQRVLSGLLDPSATQQQEIIFELYVLFRARSVQFQAYREKRFEHLVREIDDRRRGWSTDGERPTEGKQKALSRGESVNFDSFPPPTILDLMLHLGCMDYAKLTFPMPMAGGGILQGHIFAKVAAAAGHGLFDKRPKTESVTVGDEKLERIYPAIATNGAALSSAYDYDYIAEWVNHRSDEIGLQLDFVDTVTEIVDELRNVDRSLRTDTFRSQMRDLEMRLAAHNDWFGFDPSGAASEPKYKIVHFALKDCRVFRTKARAPSLLTCVVRRDDADLEWSMQSLMEQRQEVHRARSVSSNDAASSEMPGERGTMVDVEESRASVGVFHRAEGQAVVADLLAAEGMLEQLSSSRNVAKTIERARAGSEEVAGSGHAPPPLCVEVGAPAASTGERSDTPPSTGSRRNSRLASHAKTRSMSLMHQSRSIEKELNSSFGVADGEVEGVGTPVGDAVPRAASVPARLNGHGEVAPVEEGEAAAETAGESHRVSTGHIVVDKRTNEQSFISVEHPSVDTAAAGSPEHQAPMSPGAAQRAREAAAEEDRLTAEVTRKVVASARALLMEGKISEKEFDTLINCDTKYRDEATRNELELASVRLEECFGEPWEEHKENILAEYLKNSPNVRANLHHIGSNELLSTAQWPELDVRQFIVKSNDDLRQEVCCLQLIELCQEIFADVTSHGASTKCELWLKTYRICLTNSTTGIVQVIPDSMSIDALKKTEGFVSLPHHFERVYGTSPERLHEARQNFVASLAAYSVVCYMFQIKDRHNGNILLDREGHIIHIDFGFLLGIAPGGSFSIESAPFKLTEEMVDTFGGLDSPYFSDFLRAFTSGFLALRANSETIVSTLSLMSTQSTFPCFAGKDTNLIIDKLRGRFRTDLSVKDAVQHCLDLIIESYSHYGTKQYDNFQWLTNGIVQ